MEEKKNIPEIRFKGFEGEWEEKKIGEISNTYSGGTPSVGVNEFYNGCIPFIRSAEINYNSTELSITELGLKSSSAKMVNVGDILYALYGATSGEVGRSKLKGAINQAILAIIPFKEFDSEFIMQWLRKKKNVIISTYLQGGQGNLSGSTVKNLIIDSPIVEEQSQIGSFFQNLDKQITLEQQKYDKLVTLKKAMLEKMFPKEGEDVPEIRFKGFEEKWEEKRLGEIAYISTGYPFESKSFEEGGEYLVITNGNIQNESPFVDNAIGSRINIMNNPIYNDYVLIKGDILVTMDGTVGRIAKVNDEKQILAQRVGRIQALEDSEFLYQLLCTGNFIKNMTLLSTGGTIRHITLRNIMNYRDLIPSTIKEQTKIGSFFQNLDKLISLQQKKIDKLKNIKKACLEKMFV